jgi:hypothetical protein
MPTYSWRNIETDEHVELHCTISERNNPPELEGTWERVLEMPMHMRVAYVDGQRKDLHDFKAAAKLQQKASELPKNDPARNDIQKEIDGRKKANKKVTKGI